MNTLAKLLAILIFIPGGLLWLVLEALYILAAWFRVIGYTLATVSWAIGGLLVKEERKELLSFGFFFALKYFIQDDIDRQRKALRISSTFFNRDDD